MREGESVAFRLEFILQLNHHNRVTFNQKMIKNFTTTSIIVPQRTLLRLYIFRNEMALEQKQMAAKCGSFQKAFGLKVIFP